MAERDVAIAKIQCTRGHLITARDLLTPIEDFGYLELIDHVGAFNLVLHGIQNCNGAEQALQVAPGVPSLGFYPTSFSTTYPNSPPQISVTNTGTGTLVGAITPRGSEGGPAPAWLQIAPSTFSLTQDDTAYFIASIDWDNVPEGSTLTAEFGIDSNGGNGEIAVEVVREGAPGGDPILGVSPPVLNIVYDDTATFNIFNAGDQSKMISYTVTEEEAYNWLSQSPNFGTVTSEPDVISVIPDWDTWPTQQGVVIKTGNVVVNGTYQGNQVEGSPTNVYVECSKDTGTGSSGDNCIWDPDHGVWTCVDDPNGNSTGCGDGAWVGWCKKLDIVTVGGEKAMGRKGEATFRPDRYVPESNDVIVRMEVSFPPDWHSRHQVGGQHFFNIGTNPIRDGHPDHDNCIRFDIGIREARWGFKVVLRHTRNGNGELDTIISEGSIQGDNRFPNADTFYPVEFHAHHNPSNGSITGKIVYPDGERTFNHTIQPGNPYRLGRNMTFGNVENRDGRARMRNVTFTIGGNTFAL